MTSVLDNLSKMEREAALRTASPNEKIIAAHAASMIQHNIGNFGLQYNLTLPLFPKGVFSYIAAAAKAADSLCRSIVSPVLLPAIHCI